MHDWMRMYEAFEDLLPSLPNTILFDIYRFDWVWSFEPTSVPLKIILSNLVTGKDLTEVKRRHCTTQEGEPIQTNWKAGGDRSLPTGQLPSVVEGPTRQGKIEPKNGGWDRSPRSTPAQAQVSRGSAWFATSPEQKGEATSASGLPSNGEVGEVMGFRSTLMQTAWTRKVNDDAVSHTHREEQSAMESNRYRNWNGSCWGQPPTSIRQEEIPKSGPQ